MVMGDFEPNIAPTCIFKLKVIQNLGFGFALNAKKYKKMRLLSLDLCGNTEMQKNLDWRIPLDLDIVQGFCEV